MAPDQIRQVSYTGQIPRAMLRWNMPKRTQAKSPVLYSLTRDRLRAVSAESKILVTAAGCRAGRRGDPFRENIHTHTHTHTKETALRRYCCCSLASLSGPVRSFRGSVLFPSSLICTHTHEYQHIISAETVLRTILQSRWHTLTLGKVKVRENVFVCACGQNESKDGKGHC